MSFHTLKTRTAQGFQHTPTPDVPTHRGIMFLLKFAQRFNWPKFKMKLEQQSIVPLRKYRLCYLLLYLRVKVTYHKILFRTLHFIWPLHLQILSCYVQRCKEPFKRKYIGAAKYLPHHVTFAPAKFEVTTYTSLGGYAFTRKCIIWPWPCRTKRGPVPTTPWGLQYAHANLKMLWS